MQLSQIKVYFLSKHFSYLLCGKVFFIINVVYFIMNVHLKIVFEQHNNLVTATPTDEQSEVLV